MDHLSRLLARISLMSAVVMAAPGAGFAQTNPSAFVPIKVVELRKPTKAQSEQGAQVVAVMELGPVVKMPKMPRALPRLPKRIFYVVQETPPSFLRVGRSGLMKLNRDLFKGFSNQPEEEVPSTNAGEMGLWFWIGVAHAPTGPGPSPGPDLPEPPADKLPPPGEDPPTDPGIGTTVPDLPPTNGGDIGREPGEDVEDPILAGLTELCSDMDDAYGSVEECIGSLWDTMYDGLPTTGGPEDPDEGGFLGGGGDTGDTGDP